MATGAIGSSALDVNMIVTQLMEIQRQPLVVLQRKQGLVESKLSAWSRIQGALSSLQTAAASLTKTTTFDGRTTSVSGDLVAASAADTAVAGRYLVGVERLARAQSVASGVFAASTDTLGAGRITLTEGTYNSGANTFTAGADAPVTVDIAAGDTLADIRDKINAANAGVTAGLVTDSSGVRLTLMSRDAGASNGFKLTVDEDTSGTIDNPADLDTTGLSKLAFDPTLTAYDAGTPGSGGKNLTQTQEAVDAKFTVNGLTLYSASNTVTTAIEGVTLSLRKEAAAGTVNEVAIERSATRAKDAASALVKAYNDFEKLVADFTKFDPQAKTAAALNGDSALRSVQSQVRQTMRAAMTAAAGDYTLLSEIGFEFQRDGALKLDDSKFSTALSADADKVSRLFLTTSAVTAEKGFAVRLKEQIDSIIGTDGTLVARQQGLQADIKLIGQRQDQFERRLENIELRLRREYSALDVLVSRNQSTSNSLASALAALPKASGQ